MKQLTLAEFRAAIKAQGAADERDIAFRCPLCGTVQSARSLIAAGAGATLDEVERFLAFSCVGRFTGAGPYRQGDPSGRGCDWTLGGLFSLHELEVIDTSGKAHPRFDLATPEEMRALAESFAKESAAKEIADAS